MKNRKREIRKGAPVAAVATAEAGIFPPGRQIFAVGVLITLAVALWAYAPALNGPFLFDDNFLPFAVSNVSVAPLTAWLRGQRPLLMATYWVSAQLSPNDTWWFHAINIVIHCVTAGLVYFIVRRLLEWLQVEQPRRRLLAALAAGLFLLHPAQSEAVAYVAGRSESLSVMFAFAAFAVFLYRPDKAAGWRTVGIIFGLFGAALLSKEQTIALPALFLLTDFWFNPGWSFQGIRDNWKLYLPMLAGAVLGMIYFLPLITGASTAGFGMKDFTWYQYFFTQWRAIFVYMGMFLFPANLTLDWDFPISHTVTEHGAIIWLAVLLAMAVGAWMLRRRFPLASFGFFAFLLLMAPTSSILPIRDPVAERRLYFGILGLLLMLVDFVGRIRMDRRTLVGLGIGLGMIAALVTHVRAQVWSDPIAIWQDTVLKSPNAWRPHFQLGFTYYSAGRYSEAISEFEKAGKLHPADADLLLDWGLAYDALNQPEQALDKLHESAKLKQTAHVYSQIGMVNGKLERWQQSLAALTAAQHLDPNFADTYVYLGVLHTKNNLPLVAIEDFRRALQLDPGNTRAQQFLKAVATQMRGAQPKK